MPYLKKPGQVYNRRKPSSIQAANLSRKLNMMSSHHSIALPSAIKRQRFNANFMDLTRFLAGYLSGQRNIIITAVPGKNAGYALGRDTVRKKTYFHIYVPDWSSYKIPVTDEEK